MWYLVWIIGIALALLFSIMMAIWGENTEARRLLDEEENQHG